MASDIALGSSTEFPVEDPDSIRIKGIVGRESVISPSEPNNERLGKIWDDPPGFFGWFLALQNDAIGGRMMAIAFVFFLLGGIMALLMRTQLLWGESEFLSPQTFNELFTMHGSVMMFLFAVPMLEGFAIYLLPFILGNREMPFPRLGQFSFFTFTLGGLLFLSSFLFGAVPDAGWFAYVPLSGPEYSRGLPLDFWLLGLGVAEIAAIAAGIEITIAIMRMRAPGMTLSRMPVIAWAYLVMALAILVAFTTLLVASLMLELDRKFGTQFFNPAAGGSAILWQHLFWVFGHPEVYIQFIPATGMISMIIPVFARHRLVGYNYVVISLITIGFLSFALWAHHMFTAGLPQAAMSFFTIASIMIGVPAGIQIFSWISTIFFGRPVWTTSFLFVIGFLFTFVLGGISGIMVGVVPLDLQVHDSYFVVAHFHYVLIGGATFPILAAFYYWFPLFTGRKLNEGTGKWNFWLTFIGFHITFFPMHIVGLLGMPRRVYTYQEGIGWEIYNQISTIGSYILALGILLFVINVVTSWRRGEKVESNPWKADSLEWATSIPAPSYGFAELPIVQSRNPLWDEKDIRQEEELETDRRQENRAIRCMLQNLAGWPLTWRAALTTSAIDARPTEVFRVSGPSIWPVVTAVGLILIFASEIFSLRILVLSGAAIVVLGMIGWHWPSPVETTEHELEFERTHGIPVYPNGSPTVDRWATALFILILAVCAGLFIFSYFYISLAHVAWPMDNMDDPRLLLPAIGTVAVLLAAAAMGWANRRITRGDVAGLRIALALAFIAGGVAAGTLVYDLLAVVTFDHNINAYGSLYWALTIFLIALLLGGLGQNLFTQVWSWFGIYSAREHVAVDIGKMYWYSMVAFWLLLAGTVYISPYIM
ncbi:MAG: cbb3-type cytochrome c oxidase subunit I [Caldilineaceae bacterium]|nr:cbb3-type cytochrome c oxidase subunit I [Caldilineaceae bacterium]